MSVFVSEAQQRIAQKIVANGSDSLDLKKFWEDQAQSIADPWSPASLQLPLGINMSNECVFTELQEKEDWYRLLHDEDYRVLLESRYNDQAEGVVGKRLLGERRQKADRIWPYVKGLHDIFEAKNQWITWSYWLLSSAENPSELEGLLDRVERRLETLNEFVLPDNWDAEKERLTNLGCPVPLYRNQRGPVTFAMSVYGVENLIYLIYDYPDLAARFRDMICRAILERARILDEEAGYTPEDAPHGFSWADDNCCMLNPELYRFFGFPIIEQVFARYSPNTGDERGQHSDSDMAHLLPLLGKLNFSWVNFGPTLSVTEIRNYLPGAIIRGQLAPFTFCRNEEVAIVAETLRDFDLSREQRGVVFGTAGSINNGSRLSGMRLIMSTIQEYCRYV